MDHPDSYDFYYKSRTFHMQFREPRVTKELQLISKNNQQRIIKSEQAVIHNYNVEVKPSQIAYIRSGPHPNASVTIRPAQMHKAIKTQK